MTGRAVRDCGRFAEAVDALTDGLGVDARAAILSMEVPLSREEIRTIAALLKASDFMPVYDTAPEPAAEEEDGMAPDKVMAVLERMIERQARRGITS
jgi:hypothetical protein